MNTDTLELVKQWLSVSATSVCANGVVINIEGQYYWILFTANIHNNVSPETFTDTLLNTFKQRLLTEDNPIPNIITDLHKLGWAVRDTGSREECWPVAGVPGPCSTVTPVTKDVVFYIRGSSDKKLYIDIHKLSNCIQLIINFKKQKVILNFNKGEEYVNKQ